MPAISFSRVFSRVLLKRYLPPFSYPQGAKLLVVSAQNLRSAGGLSILLQVLTQLSNCKTSVHVVCFSASLTLIPQNLLDKLSCTVITLPLSSKSWLIRIYYEYLAFYFFSRHLNVDIWLALNDLSPFVKAKKKILLFHNAILFWKPSSAELLSSINVCIAWLAYKILVPINIRANDSVVVQAFWIKDVLQRMYRLANDRVCVINSYPELPITALSSVHKSDGTSPLQSIHIHSPLTPPDHDSSFKLLYPCFPRPFKNLPRLILAVQNLYSIGLNISLFLTFDKDTNFLSRSIVKSYPGYPFRYFGFLSKDDLAILYNNSDSLIFPSTLETLGLPLVEYSSTYYKPILASNLPYAVEALSCYDNKFLFNPYDVKSIESAILTCIASKSLFNLPANVSPPNFNIQRNDMITGWAQFIDLALSS